MRAAIDPLGPGARWQDADHAHAGFAAARESAGAAGARSDVEEALLRVGRRSSISSQSAAVAGPIEAASRRMRSTVLSA